MPEHTKAVTRKVDLLPAPMVALVQSLVPDCNALLPADISSEQFRAALWLELTGRPALATCSLASLRTCIVQAANDGMLPGRDTYFLPFRVRGQMAATKVDNYHGLQRALERTGKVVRSWAAAVCEGDTWEFDRFMDRPKHVEAMTLGKAPGRELFYYGAVLFKDGTCAFEPISLDELAAIERSAPSHDSGPWKDWPQMMKRKSALKRVCKYVPVTPQVQAILDADDERLQTDIPPARHHQNIVDLFGDDPRGSTPPPEPPLDVDPATGELLPEPVESPTPKTVRKAAGASQVASSTPTVTPQSQRKENGNLGYPEQKDGFAWTTLRAHQDDAKLPQALRDAITTALSVDEPATDAEADTLAGAILDTLHDLGA